MHSVIPCHFYKVILPPPFPECDLMGLELWFVMMSMTSHMLHLQRHAKIAQNKAKCIGSHLDPLPTN